MAILLLILRGNTWVSSQQISSLQERETNDVTLFFWADIFTVIVYWGWEKSIVF